MSSIQQEIAQLQVEFDSLIASWNALNPAERRREWNAYLNLTDEGGAGWHRFARLLINSFCEGWSPIAGVERSREGELSPICTAAT